MRNAGLEEAQAGIKISRRNINNLTYADDTTLMAVGEEELKSLLMKVKEESEKIGLKLNYPGRSDCKELDMTEHAHTSRFVIAFFPRSKCLLISWLQSPPAVILEPKKIKSAY